jgi:RNA polymerase sigma-70 factor (ECF subfamily)
MNEETISDSELELTEKEVVQRVQKGDHAGFEYLYRSTSKMVYAICLRMLKNQADAEDLTQQVFLQLFRKIGNFRGESPFSTWAYRVACNVVLMHLRRKNRVEVQSEIGFPGDAEFEAPAEFGPVDTSMSGEPDRLNLKRAIGRLPGGYKRLFLLHDVWGYEHHEIAKLVGCSIGTSQSQVRKARRRLQQLLCGEQI